MTATVTNDLIVEDGVLDTVYEHVEPYPEQEVGGFLVGTLTGRQVTIQHALPALEAVGHRAQLTFTHGVWEEMLARVDREFPDLRIVGWYHSHPGFGIFLSEYDKFIQRNFFSAPGMVALVADSHSGEHGWFGWANGDQGGDDDDIVLLDGPPSEPREPKAPTVTTDAGRGISAGTAVLVGAVVAVAAFAGGLAMGGWGSQPQAPAVQDNAPPVEPVPGADDPDDPGTRSDDGDAVAASDEATGRVVIDYRIRRGDSLWALAESFYGSGSAYGELVDANPRVDADSLDVGEVLRVPVDGEPEEEG